MHLHLVGGFLGSGKTTAIIHAARLMMTRGLKVGVITNDQGKYLVDTAFFRLANLPAVEVGGGCFCCNYDDLSSRLDGLIASAQPDVIFAESVGSCADIVATVIKPLLALRTAGGSPTSFSVFADSRLLRRRLSGAEMPFSDEIVYIYDQQLAEAGLIIANKIDMLSADQRGELDNLLTMAYPETPRLLQSSLEEQSVRTWIDYIESGAVPLPCHSLVGLDYARYGAGEAQLAWLDADWLLQFPSGQGRERVSTALARLLDVLRDQNAAIGHLKFILADQKISFPTLDEPDWQAQLPEIPGDSATLLVNARVAIPATTLESAALAAFETSGIQVEIRGGLAFHPPQPRPTHRMD